MKIVHHFLNRVIAKETDFLGVLMTDNIGGYFLLTDNQTRYQGWHIRLGQNLFKIIDSIIPLGQEKPQALENRVWKIRRCFQNFYDEIILPNGFCGFYYNLNVKNPVEIRFDIKKGYENPVEGRFYSVNLINKNYFHIHFEQKQAGGATDFSLDVVGRINQGKITKKEIWENVYYPYDKYRQSEPCQRWVFNALKIDGAKEVIIAAGENFTQARKNLDKIYKNKKTIINKSKKISERQVRYYRHLPPNISWSISLCRASLKNLLVFNSENNLIEGIYAGLPWFYQFWWRDEATSLKALALQDLKIAKTLSLKRLKDFLKLTDLSFSTPTQSLDGLLLYLKNIYELAKIDNFFNKDNKKLLYSAYIHISKLLKDNIKNNLLMCDSKKTWMDSIKRSDFPVEIQFLYASFLRDMYQITKNTIYLNDLNKLTQNIRQQYFKDGILLDGLDDKTIRPNIFLAYYYYPRILRKKEWEVVFNNALEKLFLSWGGIATLDKTHLNFNRYYTGENPQSYHQGDSWFYLNNITANVLLDVNAEKFAPIIKLIIQASSNDILYCLVGGHSSELSSADNFAPAGCFCQLWSSATLLELLMKIYHKI